MFQIAYSSQLHCGFGSCCRKINVWLARGRRISHQCKWRGRGIAADSVRLMAVYKERTELITRRDGRTEQILSG